MKTKNEPTGKDGKFEDERKHNVRITARELKFVDGLVENKSASQAARDAGYSKSTANSRAHEWIRDNRETSKKPDLWDLYQKRVKAKLRLHDITVDNVLSELKIIGFSSIDHFIEFPSLAKLRQQRKVDALTRHSVGIITEEDEKYLSDEKISLEDYRPGSTIKLKNYEDIPKELIPAISEISEMKDGGIKIKLHDKLNAIDKLCRYLKIYETEETDPNEFNISEINIVVNGTKSPLLGVPIQAPAKRTA